MDQPFDVWGKRLVLSSFFDLYTKLQCSNGASHHCPSCQLSGLTTLEAQFVTKAHPTVLGFLQTSGCQLLASPTHLAIVDEVSQQPISMEQFEGLVQSVAKTFLGPQPFTYESVLLPLLRGYVVAVSALLLDIFPPSSTPEVSITANQMFGGFMCPYDLCFETNGTSNRMSYPDFNNLSPEHHNWYFRLPTISSLSDREHFSYLLETLAVPSHEVFHFCQAWVGQQDTSHGSWSAEHDASVPSLSLLHFLGSGQAMDAAKGQQKHFTEEQLGLLEYCESMLSGGVLEATMMEQVRQAEAALALMTQSELTEYNQYRAHFGVYAPNLSVDSTFISNNLKIILPYEWFTDDTEELKKQLRAIFGPERQGVDTATQPIPSVHGLGLPFHTLFDVPCNLGEFAKLRLTLTQQQ